MLQFRWLNCLWLLVPLLIWNVVLTSKLPQEAFRSDLNIPQWILIGENLLRVVVFAISLFLPLQLKNRMSQIGIFLYSVGALIYFASWLPLLFAPHKDWSTSNPGLLAPYVTPLLAFLGIALIARSWANGQAAVLFISLYILHGLYATSIF